MNRAVAFIFLTVLLDSVGFGIVIPVMPQLIAQVARVDIAPAAVIFGWLSFAFAAVNFVSSPILGNLSDRFGRRPVLLFSMAAFSLDYLVTGLAPTLGWLFAGRIVAGIAGACWSPSFAYLADISPPEKRAQNFGAVGAAFGMGFVIGPAIGGFVGEFGPRVPFFVAAACAAANFCFGYFALPESLAPANRRPFEWKRASPVGALLQLRKYPVVFALLGATFLWQLGHQVLPSTWAFYATLRFGWTQAGVGLSLTAVGVIMAFSQGFLTKILVPKWGERRTAAIGLVAALLAYSAYALVPEGWMIYVAMLPWALAALSYPSLQALMSQQVPANAQGELQGGAASLFSLSSIVGPPLFTQLFGFFSAPDAPVHFPGAAFMGAAVLTCGSLALLLKSRAAV